MSVSYISAALRRAVEKRADYCCEYCRLHADLSFYPHEIDHVIAEKHGGLTELDNLAYACWRCNRRKGSDLGSWDLETGSFAFLFNPRSQRWSDHFEVREGEIIGLTPEGRTTVSFLQLNNPDRIKERWLES